MPISKLLLTNLGPFDEIEFEFDKHVNVFAGPNNSGKSTVLMALGELLVWRFGLPKKLLRAEPAEFKVELAQTSRQFEGRLPLRGERLSDAVSFFLTAVGYTSFVPAIRRSTDFRAKVPTLTESRDNRSDPQPHPQSSWPSNLSRSIEETKEQHERQVILSYTSSEFRLKRVEELSKRTEELGEQIEGILERTGRKGELGEGQLKQVEELRKEIEELDNQIRGLSEQAEELQKRTGLIQTDASLVSDEDVVQKIIELDYRAYRKGTPEIRNIIDTTTAIASEITEGYPIRFVRVDEDEDGLFPQFETSDGLVPLNVLSQGTQSLVQWLARLLIDMVEYYDYPENIEEKGGILIIDEIDAHLHPSWQRRIIPALTNHFPNLQIFCSTHSPLMLAGLKAGQVQLLDRDESGKVTVSRNEQDIVGWSADEILRSFLDVPSPTDLETVQNIERMQELRQIDGLTDEQANELNHLRETVRRDLIGGPLATELDELRSILNESTHSSSTDSPSP